MSIRLLDTRTAELIAAGEVVERPASVVKELLENALDAGATAIELCIEGGGLSLIQVADNGGGIAAQDVPTAFLRHATSKLRCEDDLEAISTLGFRGEALPSIAGVAKVELLTKSDADEAATLYRIAGGKAGGCESAARARGSTFTVRDLFYNTPARMKFLKKDASEGNFVTEAAGRLALSHPEVAVRYLRDGREIFATPGGDLLSAAFTVLGSAFARGLWALEDSGGGYEVGGYVTPPSAMRASRSMQYFYVNGRFVKNRTMAAALEQAYRGMAMSGRFPGGIVYLQMPAQWLDVNVHPAKTEVRFAREQDVFDAVYRAVKAALIRGGGELADASFAWRRGTEDKDDAAAGQKLEKHNDFTHAPAAASETHTGGSGGPEGDGMLSSSIAVPYAVRAPLGGVRPVPPRAQPLAKAAVPEEQQVLWGGEGGGSLRLVGELFRSYAVAELGDALVLIDKHAAHERLLYDRLAAARTAPHAQQLLAPLSVALGAQEKDALLQNSEALDAVGLTVEDFGGGAVLVRAVPDDVTNGDVEGLLQEAAARLCVNPRDSTAAKTEWVMHSVACRAALKAGDRTHPQELLRLAEDILSGAAAPYCPHGRPVVLRITRRELERQFGRLG